MNRLWKTVWRVIARMVRSAIAMLIIGALAILYLFIEVLKSSIDLM